MRSGTTWLAKLLDSYPDCRIMPFKELHFFDVKYGKYGGAEYYRTKAQRLATLTGNVAKRMVATLEKLELAPGGEWSAESDVDERTYEGVSWTDEVRRQFLDKARVGRSLKRISEIIDVLSVRDVTSYVAYLQRHAVGASAFGDITPAYALLPATAYADMDRALPGARFIFVMRDPVDRLWSHVRYELGRRERRSDTKKDRNKIFRTALQRPSAIARSSYRSTIEELESVIPGERILYLFHESMTSPDTGPAEIRRIETLLGLNPKHIESTLFSTPVNSSAPAELTRENELAALEYFAPTYAFVERKFGRPKHWRSPSEIP